MGASKKILLTGIAGFIGFHTAMKLLSEGHTVIGIDNLNDYYDPKLKIDRLAQLGIIFDGQIRTVANNVVFYFGDIQDKDLIEDIWKAEAFTEIINLAAQAGVRYSLENPNAYVDTNISGFLNILELAKSHEIQHVIYASSSSVYGASATQPFVESDPCNDPISMYAATKKANEIMAGVYSHLYGLRLTGLRFFTVYGPWGRPDMAPMLFAKAAYDRTAIKIFNFGKQARDFTYVDDIVNGIFGVFKKQETIPANNIFNIGNGNPVNLLSFIEILERTAAIPIQKEFVEAQPGDVEETYADISKLKEYIHFEPLTPIEEGVRKFNNWFKEYYN